MADIGSTKGEAALIVALAGGATIRDAARRASIGERTVYRRLDEPDFRQQVQAARADMVAQAVGKLADAATKAVDTLSALLDGDSESVRLGAARAILEIGTKLRDATEFEARLAALEATAQARGVDGANGFGGRRLGVL